MSREYALAEQLAKLTPREEAVIRRLFGIDREEKRAGEIAEEFGIHLERFWQIVRKAKRKLGRRDPNIHFDWPNCAYEPEELGVVVGRRFFNTAREEVYTVTAIRGNEVYIRADDEATEFGWHINEFMARIGTLYVERRF